MEKTIHLDNKRNTDFQVDNDIAALVDDSYGNPEEWFYDIDPGVYDYLVKCVGGIHADISKSLSNKSVYSTPLYESKYFHINTARKYEIIGSSQNEEDGCTVWIENANLQPVHAEIRLKEAYNYYITQDSELSDEDYFKWVHHKFNSFERLLTEVIFIRVLEQGVDLYSLKENKMLKFGNVLVGLIRSFDLLFDEVGTWIKSNGLEYIKPYIETNNIETLKDLKLHTETIIRNAISDNVISNLEEAKKLRIILNEIDPSRSFKKKPLLYLNFVPKGERLYLDGEELTYKLGKDTVINDKKPMSEISDRYANQLSI
jgi:hypothetical protein